MHGPTNIKLLAFYFYFSFMYLRAFNSS